MRAPLYLTEQGSSLHRRGRRLAVVKEGEQLALVPLIQVSQVIVFGNVSITTPALKLLLREGVETVLLTRSGRFCGRLVGARSGHGALRVAQVLRSQQPGFARDLARRFVRGKVHNMRVFLQRAQRRAPQEALPPAIAGLKDLRERVEQSQTHNSLSGVEGRATAIYFGAWKGLLQAPWRFAKRLRRPPTDPVNVLLSLGYTILTHNVVSAVQTAGLDPHVGFLHQLTYNRPSLALDLVEEFRTPVVDSVVLRCLNNDILQPDHFRAGDEGERPVVLEREGLKRFIAELERRLERVVKDPSGGERLSYRRILLKQAYQIARILREEAPPSTYQPFLVR